MKVLFHDAARLEVEESFAYYRDIDPALADAFRSELRHALLLIEQHQNAWHPLGQRLRHCLMKRFPYAIIYTSRPGDIIVIAVAHTRRRPRYWRQRTKSDKTG